MTGEEDKDYLIARFKGNYVELLNCRCGATNLRSMKLGFVTSLAKGASLVEKEDIDSEVVCMEAIFIFIKNTWIENVYGLNDYREWPGFFFFFSQVKLMSNELQGRFCGSLLSSAQMDLTPATQGSG